MAEQSASRLSGDDYQHLYSWHELLELLKEGSRYDHGYVEHPAAGAADDVTLHPPDASDQPAKYVQVKFHVDQSGAYSFDEFLKTQKANKQNLLQKLFASWKELHPKGVCEIWLVTNWACDSKFGSVARGINCALHQDFLDSTPRTDLGKAKTRWKSALGVGATGGATEEEFEAFIKALRFEFSYSHKHIEKLCDYQMEARGLKTGTAAQDHAITAVRTWIKEGGANKRIDKNSIRDVIAKYSLRMERADVPQVSLCIHGWAKRKFDVALTLELDWTSNFDRQARKIPDETGWDLLKTELEAAKATFANMENATFIDFRGQVPLSCALMIGFVFPSVGGYAFRTEQHTNNVSSLWNPKTATGSDALFEVKVQEGGAGDDALVVLAVTDSIPDEARAFYTSGQVPFTKLVYAEPNKGTDSKAINEASDAIALAISAKNLLRDIRGTSNAKRLHLVVYGPQSLALFLGQQLNAVGEIITYERTGEGGYQPAARLRTG